MLAILAAGSSSRAGVDKVLADLGGHPVLAWSLQAAQVAGSVRRANEAGAAREEIEREGLWAVQTPQVFRRELLERARAAAGDRSFSDDAAAVVAAGMPVKMVPGER